MELRGAYGRDVRCQMRLWVRRCPPSSPSAHRGWRLRTLPTMKTSPDMRTTSTQLAVRDSVRNAYRGLMVVFAEFGSPALLARASGMGARADGGTSDDGMSSRALVIGSGRTSPLAKDGVVAFPDGGGPPAAATAPETIAAAAAPPGASTASRPASSVSGVVEGGAGDGATPSTAVGHGGALSKPAFAAKKKTKTSDLF